MLAAKLPWGINTMTRLIEYLPIDRLRAWPRNARTHSRKRIRQISESISRFGFTNPVLIDGDNRILAVHGRVEAARELGRDSVPCLRIAHMTPAEKRAYVLADNKLALNAGWDEELLALELKELMEADIDLDIGITGFPIRSPFLRAAAPATFGARAASSDLRRCAQSQCGRRPNGRRKCRDGLHRPALQCGD